MRFDLIPLRLAFIARDPLCFPPGKAANVWRGAFGMALARVAPAAEYARLFEPRGDGPSGLADRPRPFVFRVRHLDGAAVRAGESFQVRMNLFTLDAGARDWVVRALEDAAREGIGPGRGRADLSAISGDVVSVDLTPDAAAPPRIRVEFLSPTELKHEQGLADRPEFGALFARVRDRVGALRAFYGAGPLELDFAAMGARAAQVWMTRCDCREVVRERRSSRTGQTHSLGGFAGVAEYEGALAEFLPFLRAAEWTGVGRQAVWGKGEISVSCIM